MVDVNDINPFKNFGVGAIGVALLILFIAILILGLIGLLVFIVIRKRQYKYKIPLYKKVGAVTIRVGYYKARNYPIGRAGDNLWYVGKIKKFIPPATIQTAPFEYSHFEREDGEWINIGLPDIDEHMKKFGVKYIHQDMRSNRVAINELLDLRFTQKSWWEKYGHLVTHVIFYLIVAVSMVIIFWMWGDITEQVSVLFDSVVAYENKKCGGTIVPAISLLFWRVKKWNLQEMQ